MIVSDDSLPEPCNFIVSKPDVTRCNCTTRESTDQQVVEITTKLFTDATNILFAVLNSCLPVAPPCNSIVVFIHGDIGHDNPDKLSAAADSITKVGVFYFATSLTWGKLVSSEFNKNRIFFLRDPFSRQIERVIDIRATIFRSLLPDAFSCCRCIKTHRWCYKISCMNSCTQSSCSNKKHGSQDHVRLIRSVSN